MASQNSVQIKYSSIFKAWQNFSSITETSTLIIIKVYQLIFSPWSYLIKVNNNVELIK